MICLPGVNVDSVWQFSCVNMISYRTRAITTRGFYIFYPIFADHFFVIKDVLSENFVFIYC